MAAGVISRFQKQLEESEASDRSFGLIIGAAFVVIGLVRLLRHGQIRWWAVCLGAVLVLLAVLAPATLTGLKRAWLFVGFLLGLVVNPLVLSILFFAVITPAAALLRLFGHDPLHRKMATDAKSYWQGRSVSVSDMRMQF
jgi:predicted membrane protein